MGVGEMGGVVEMVGVAEMVRVAETVEVGGVRGSAAWGDSAVG